MSGSSLGDRLDEFGDCVAAIDDAGTAISYADLVRRADVTGGIIGADRKLVLLECAQTTDWLVAYVACLRGRHPVLLAPAGSVPVIERLRERFEPDVVMRSADGFQPVHMPGGRIAPHPDLAVLLSTSGSTGSTKCVRLSHDNVAANARSIAEYLKIGADERGCANLPVHYSYGLSIVNSHLHAGATVLLTGGSVIDGAFWGFLKTHGATSFAGVPHVYDLLSRIDLAASAPPTLRYFTQAGGRLPPATAERFLDLAARRGWRFYIMYGQTEATARIAYLPPELAAEHPDCIGVPIPDGRLSLIDDAGQSVELPDSDGELIYDGPNVMMGYATERVDLALPAGPSRLATGDIAQRTKAGLFRITGRRSRFIKIFGNRIGLDDVERLLADDGHAAVATGIDEHLLVVTREAAAPAAITRLLTQRLKLPTTHVEVRAVTEYPVLVSGKIDYAGLKASITKRGETNHPADGRDHPAGIEAGVQAAFVSVFGDAANDTGVSFNALGGDSLTYVTIAIALEDVLTTLPDDWESMSIARLATVGRTASVETSRISTSALVRKFTALDLMRGLCVTLVVATHAFGNHVAFLPGDPRIIQVWDLVTSVTRPIRMPALFLISGYLASRSLSRPWREIAEGRFFGLIYLYLVWLAIGVVYTAFLENTHGAAPHVMSMLAMYASRILYPTGSALWFVYALMLCYLVARTCALCRRYVPLGFALALFAVAELLPVPASYIARAPFFYLAGAYLPSLVDAVMRRATWAYVLVAAAAYLPAAGLIAYLGEDIVGIWLPASCIGVMLLLMAAAKVQDWRVLRPLIWVGRETLPIFVLQHFLLYGWMAFVAGPGAALFRPLIASRSFAAVYPAVLVAALLALSIGLHRLFRHIGFGWLFQMPRPLVARLRDMPSRRWGRSANDPIGDV